MKYTEIHAKTTPQGLKNDLSNIHLYDDNLTMGELKAYLKKEIQLRTNEVDVHQKEIIEKYKGKYFAVKYAHTSNNLIGVYYISDVIFDNYEAMIKYDGYHLSYDKIDKVIDMRLSSLGSVFGYGSDVVMGITTQQYQSIIESYNTTLAVVNRFFEE